MGLILLIVAVAAGPAVANEIQYTYTSSTLNTYSGNIPFPSPPGIGNILTVSFTHDGYLSPGITTHISNVTCTYGTTSASTADGGYLFGSMVTTDATGDIVSWDIRLRSASYQIGTDTFWWVYITSGSGEHHSYYDDAEFWANDWNHVGAAQYPVMPSQTVGWYTTAVVPLPPAALLLGSGLLGLAGLRRIRKN